MKESISNAMGNETTSSAQMPSPAHNLQIVGWVTIR
jgi:hypothetical protein